MCNHSTEYDTQTKHPEQQKGNLLLLLIIIVLNQGQQHNHAFLSTPTSTRLARVVLARGQLPHISVGIRFDSCAACVLAATILESLTMNAELLNTYFVEK